MPPIPKIAKAAVGIALGTAVCAALAAMAMLAAVPALFGKETGAGFAAVEQTLCALDRDGSAGLVIGGDSRAKSQAVPAILEAETGLPGVNAAEALNFGGDLATLVNALRKQPRILASRPVLLLSVSMDGVNDMSFANTPAAALFQYRPWEHARLVWESPRDYPAFFAGTFLPALKRQAGHAWHGDGFACDEKVYLSPVLAAAGGYRPFQGQAPGSGISLGKPGRYLIDGARWRVFRESLRWLAASPARALVLYDAPFDSVWLAANRGTPGLAAEIRFAEMAGREAARYPQAHWLDYFDRPPAALSHGDFHNGSHLNDAGAAKFSRILADTLRGLGLSAPGTPVSNP
jgi:hypothetical protein